MLYHHVKHALRDLRHGLPMETIGDRIRIRRLELGLTQEQLGGKCREKVSKQAVGQWENETTKSPTGPHFVDAAEALGVTERWLATGDEPKERSPALGDAERRLIWQYRRMTDRDRATIRNLADSFVPLDDKGPFTQTM